MNETIRLMNETNRLMNETKLLKMNSFLRKLVLILILGILCASSSLSQNFTSHQIDSLSKAGAECSKAGVKALLELQGYYYYNSNHSKHRSILYKAIDCANTIEDKAFAYNAYYSALMYYQRFPELDTVLTLANEMLNIAKIDTSFNVF